MGSVKEEITRLETAKKDIETAIETCGVNVPDTELIDTYASYIRQIPSAVFSGLNVDPVGGADQFIQSIKQTNGLIEATVGGLVSTSNSGLVPKADGSAGVINSPSDDYVLTYKGGTIDWYKLPANAFKNDDNNTTYTLSGTLNGNAYNVTLTPSSGSATGAKVPAMGAASSSAAGTAGLVPAPAKNKHNSFLRGDGTWAVPDNTTYSVMTGATASAAGKSGLVPQPAKGDQGKFLSGAGTWTALPSLSITDSESGNAVTDVEVSGHGITLKRGTTFSVNGHKHSSDDITALTSYIKATAASAIASTDSLNTALGKLELKADTAYNLVKGAYDGDGIIENLAEILKVLEGISDTDTIQAIVGKYLPLAGGMMTGNITFDTNRMIRWHQSDSYSISCPTGGDGAYLLLKAHNGITAKKRLSIYTNAESLPNTNYNLYTDGSLYAASAVFGGNTKITGGSDLTLQASSGAQGDAGDIVFSDYSGAELGRIWLDSTASQALSLRYGANDATKRILHSGNAYISNGVITINGVSITPLTSHQSLANYVTLNTAQTISATKTFSAQQSFTATGKAPFTVSSDVKVDNLNADFVDGYHAASLFKRLGWNSNTTYTDANTASMPFGLMINQQSNYTSVIKNYPTGYGYLLNLSTGDESIYSGVQIYTNYNTDRTYIRSKWGSTWYDWKTLAYTSDIPTVTNYYWANIKVSASSSTSTQPTFNTCYTSNWFRSTGNTGWYNETHTGGIYMEDSTWVRTYNSKSFYCSADIQAGGRIYTGYDSGVSNSISCSNWFRSNNNTGWYNPTNECHVYPNNISSYGGLILRGVKSGYHGFLLGTSTGYMHLMDNGTDKGLYQENQSMWILYYNASSKYVGIRTSSLSYPLTINGDSYTNGWSRAANGFYVHDTGVHFTHQGTLGEIDMTSNNEFLWGSSSADLYFNYRAVSRGTTVTTYRWHAGSSTSYASHVLGKVTAQSTASSWLDGQRYERGGFNLMDATDTGSYWPWMRQTNTGSSKWFSMGVLGNCLYFIGSATSRTENSYDYGFRMDFSNGYLYGNFSGYLSGTAYSAEAIKDSNNGTRITACYSTGGFSSNPSWLAAWNGYHLTYVSPGVLSVNYATSAGSATTAGTAGRLGLTSCYGTTTNSGLWSTIKTSTNSYLGTATVYEVYDNGGPDTYGEVLDIVSVHGNHWQPQLWFGAGKAGKLRYRNKDYNDNSWGDWKTVAWTSDIPSVGNGTVTITQAGTTIGSFTMNQSGNTTINLTDNDTNYYPIRYYTSGLQISTYSGSTNCALYVPHATTSQDGVINTVDQSFKGNKTFTKINSIDPGYLLIYAGRVYKKDGSTSASSVYGMSGFSISVTKLRAGAYQVKVTNTTGRSCYIHPMLSPVFANKGEGSCYEHGFAYFSSGDSYQFPVSLSTGVSITFTIICGYMHTQGNWSSGDFTKSNDGGGFTCEIFATWSY